MPGSGRAVLSTSRSARVTIVVGSVSLLFAVLGTHAKVGPVRVPSHDVVVVALAVLLMVVPLEASGKLAETLIVISIWATRVFALPPRPGMVPRLNVVGVPARLVKAPGP